MSTAAGLKESGASAELETVLNGDSNSYTIDDDEEAVGGGGGDEAGPDMKGVPIDSADHGSSLPDPEELRTDLAARGRHTPGESIDAAFIMIIFAGLALAALIIGLAVGLSVNGPGDNDRGPWEPANPLRNAQMEDVINFLINANVTDRTLLEDSSSNQHWAAQWLSGIDDRNLEVPSVANLKNGEAYRYAARYIMALLWISTDGEVWGLDNMFMLELDICLWNAYVPYKLVTGVISYFRVGLYCDQEGRPVELYLDYMGLRGSIPDELGLLTSLQMLDFDGNEIKGNFPRQICDMKELIYLGLAHNQLNEEAPSCLSDLTNLQGLLMSNNDFMGKLPDISGLTKLQVLYLDDNRLSGDISGMFNRMKNLTYLYLDNNEFNAFVDNEFLAGLSKLQRVDFSGNNIVGIFPTHLLSTGNMTILDMHDNRLTGAIAGDITINNKLEYLAIHGNELKGAIPTLISNLRALRHFDASMNFFTGNIPVSISEMTALNYLYLADNSFSKGTIPQEFKMLTNLVELSLKATDRNGTVPEWLGALSKLTLLDLDANDFQGQLPGAISNLTQLEFLLLNRNSKLSGVVPQSWSKLQSLRLGYFDGTNLSGDMTTLCGLPNFKNKNTIGGEGSNKPFGNEVLSSDCAGTIPQVSCTCCELCCARGQLNCNPNTKVSSSDPTWEFGYDRVEYEFNNENKSTFRDIDYIPYNG